MGSVASSLPAWAKTSTTGGGAGLTAVAIGAMIASHFTANTEYQHMAGLLLGAITLVLFPQEHAAAAPTQDQAVVQGIGQSIQKAGYDLDDIMSAMRLAASATPPPVIAPAASAVPAVPVAPAPHT